MVVILLGTVLALAFGLALLGCLWGIGKFIYRRLHN